MVTKEAEIIRVLKPYYMAFPRSGMDEGALLIYARALSELEVSEINAAMLMLLKTSKFWPSVAEIFSAAKSIRDRVQGTGIPSAADAWGEAIRLVKKYGIYKPWEYSCREVEETVERFGRMELCMIEENAVNTARAQFMRMYDQVVSRIQMDRETDAVLNRLPEEKAQIAKGKIIELAEAKKIAGGAA